MSRADRFTFLSPLIVLSIVAVFAVFVVSIMYQPGLASIVITIVTCILAALFLAALTLVGIVLLIVMLADRIHHYSVLHDRRELQRKQPLGRRQQIWRIPIDNRTHSRCQESQLEHFYSL